MNYISTRSGEESASFKKAVVEGLCKDGGLFFPASIPQFPSSFFEHIDSMSDSEIALEVLRPFVANSLTEAELMDIITGTLSFTTPVVSVKDRIHALELFHGPTKAFKDVGSRFMSRCLSYFYANEKKEITILVATSGDTGSAVAHGFHNVPNVQVKVLFPKGMVSPYQQHQMTSLGGNIQAIEVAGTFDDCQALVKQAFNDEDLRNSLTLSSANSINLARLLPQMVYYFFAYRELKNELNGKKFIVSVPSGNLGNLTAGLIAKQMGLPIDHFVSALNDNDTFQKYLNSGNYIKQGSVQTYSNAMDVGNPSNFERIEYLYGKDVNAIRENVSARTYSNEDTLIEIETCFKQTNYVLDPHGAVGKLALQSIMEKDSVGLFLVTAHPEKFSEVLVKAIPSFDIPEVDLTGCSKLELNNDFSDFKELLLKAIRV